MKNIFLFLFSFSCFLINAQFKNHHSYKIEKIRDDFEEVVQTIEEVTLKSNLYDFYGVEKPLEVFVEVKIFKDYKSPSLNTIFLNVFYKEDGNLYEFDLERDYISEVGIKVAGESALIYKEPPSNFVRYKTYADGTREKLIINGMGVQSSKHPMGVSSAEGLFYSKFINSESDKKIYIKTPSYRINFNVPGFYLKKGYNSSSSQILKQIYDNASVHFTMPDFEEFKSALQDEENALKVLNNMSEYYDMPDEKTFLSDIKILNTERNLKADHEKKIENNNISEVPFAVIDQVPIFPGCEDLEKKDLRNCFQDKINEHIRNNFMYPKIAQEMGIQGVVYVEMIIDSDGLIKDIRTRGPDRNLEEAAKELIKKLPRLIPGKINGVTVRVPFSIPITYRLQ